MHEIALTYILTTRNKLPYLKETLGALIVQKEDDEEIIVSDGGSTDGTVPFLEQLESDKKIIFLRGPDSGEAHGFNKGLLAARGQLIKLITDDDVFYYPGIHACKAFMLEHLEIDFLSTDGFKRRKKGSLYPLGPLHYCVPFAQWRKAGTPFASCGLGIMLRRSSLPLLGFLNPSFVRTDAEYTLRSTAGKAQIAWYTRECYVRILNQQSNTFTQEARYFRDTARLNKLYFNARPELLKNFFAAVKRIIKKSFRTTKSVSEEQALSFAEWAELFKNSQEWLAKNAAENPGEFLWKK